MAINAAIVVGGLIVGDLFTVDMTPVRVPFSPLFCVCMTAVAFVTLSIFIRWWHAK